MPDKKKINLFFDMDGVLAELMPDEEIGNRDVMEIITKEGYFLHRPAINETVEAIKELSKDSSVSINIVSAVLKNPYAMDEKKKWLKKHLYGCEINTFFPLCGSSKFLYVKEHINTPLNNAILIDDFIENLSDWEQRGGTAVKFITPTNRNEEWNGYELSRENKLSEELKRIASERSNAYEYRNNRIL